MVYNPQVALAARQAKLAEQQADAQNDPARVFLKSLASAGGKSIASTLGNMAVSAAKYKLFGGEEELASVQRYRLFQQAVESPDARIEYKQKYGFYDPAKPPKMPESIKKEIKPVASTTPTTPTSPTAIIKPMVDPTGSPPPMMEGEPGQVGTFGRRTSAMAPGRKLGGPERPDLPSPESLTEKPEPPTQKTAMEVPKEAPKLKTYKQMAEESDPAVRGEFATEGLKRKERTRLKEQSLRTEGRKRADAFVKSADKFVDEFNERGVRMTPESRKSYVSNNVRRLLDQISTLPDPERKAAYAKLDTAFARMVGEDVFEFEQGILDNYGKVGELSTFAPRIFNNYNKVTKATDVTKQFKESTLRFLQEDANVAQLQTDYNNLGGDKRLRELGGIKRLGELEAEQIPGVTAPSKEFNELKNLIELKRELNKSQKAANYHEEQMNTARTNPEVAITPTTDEYTSASGKTVTGAAFAGKEQSQLPASIAEEREVNDLANRFGGKGGNRQRELYLDALKKENPAAFNKVVAAAEKEKSAVRRHRILASAVLANKVKIADATTTKKAFDATVNQAENAKRYKVLPEIGRDPSDEALVEYDERNGLPRGTAKAVSLGSGLNPSQTEALSGLDPRTVRVEDKGWKAAQAKNKSWLTENIYFTLTPEEKKKAQGRVFTNADAFFGMSVPQ
jgi:hypothetical protein